jgi:hypothetical protein
MPHRLLPVSCPTKPKIAGPIIPATFSPVLKKPKNSALRVFGTIVANSERLID